MREEAMETSDADIIDGNHLVSEHSGGELCFFGNRNIAGSPRDDGDFADAIRRRAAADDTDARCRRDAFSHAFDPLPRFAGQRGFIASADENLSIQSGADMV